MDEIKGGCLLVCLCTILVACLAFGLLQLNKAQTLKACEIYQYSTGRVTKFQDFGYGNFDCLTKQKDGKWIPTDNLREQNP